MMRRADILFNMRRCAGIGGLMELVQGNYEYCHYMQVCVRICCWDGAGNLFRNQKHLGR